MKPSLVAAVVAVVLVGFLIYWRSASKPDAEVAPRAPAASTGKPDAPAALSTEKEGAATPDAAAKTTARADANPAAPPKIEPKQPTPGAASATAGSDAITITVPDTAQDPELDVKYKSMDAQARGDAYQDLKNRFIVLSTPPDPALGSPASDPKVKKELEDLEHEMVWLSQHMNP